MKRVSLIITASIFYIALSASIPPEPEVSPIAKGNTNSELGYYFIEKAEPFEMINGDPLPAYYIRYENSSDTIVVAVDNMEKDLTRFLVVSENLVVEYRNEKNAFGANIIDGYFSKEGFSTNVKDIDLRQYYHQRLISHGPKSEIEYLQLISVFYPDLLGKQKKIYTAEQR